MKKRISSIEFDAALKIIVAYKLQIESDLTKNIFVDNRLINIQNAINEKTFNALKEYYQLYYSIDLKLDDLLAMETSFLKSIDYDKMALIKGFGFLSIANFKQLMVEHFILKPEDFNKLKKKY